MAREQIANLVCTCDTSTAHCQPRIRLESPEAQASFRARSDCSAQIVAVIVPVGLKAALEEWQVAPEAQGRGHSAASV